MDLLARREHSQAELQRKLLARGYPAADVGPVLVRLAEEQLLSDERFAEAFVHARMARGSGPRKIAAELAGKGVAESLISRYLNERSPVWNELAHEVRVKKFGSTLPEDYPAQARQMRFLQQRGFTGEQIRAALRDGGVDEF
jgi:regulatory protein